MITNFEANSREHACWHEAGHALAAWMNSAYPEEIFVDPKNLEKCRTRIDYGWKRQSIDLESTEVKTSLLFASAGGLAADYIAFDKNMIRVQGKNFASEDQFLATVHKFPSIDFRNFFRIRHEVPIDMDSLFAIHKTIIFSNFAHYAVVPILNMEREKLEKIFNMLLKFPNPNARQVSQILPK